MDGSIEIHIWNGGLGMRAGAYIIMGFFLDVDSWLDYSRLRAWGVFDSVGELNVGLLVVG